MLFLLGVQKLAVENLQSPANARLIRSINDTFLKKLKEKIQKDPSGPGVAPIAVLCMNVQDIENFSIRLKDVYKYEVLGGQHTATARQSCTGNSQKIPYSAMFWLKSMLASVTTSH